jgi:hypothetical protein
MDVLIRVNGTATLAGSLLLYNSISIGGSDRFDSHWLICLVCLYLTPSYVRFTISQSFPILVIGTACDIMHFINVSPSTPDAQSVVGEFNSIGLLNSTRCLATGSSRTRERGGLVWYEVILQRTCLSGFEVRRTLLSSLSFLTHLVSDWPHCH